MKLYKAENALFVVIIHKIARIVNNIFVYSMILGNSFCFVVFKKCLFSSFFNVNYITYVIYLPQGAVRSYD